MPSQRFALPEYQSSENQKHRCNFHGQHSDGNREFCPIAIPLYLFRAREQDGSIAKTKYQGLVMKASGIARPV
jgi:hypothetical protein